MVSERRQFAGALRKQAREQGVDTGYKSSGGATPLAEGEQLRPITSGDVQKMLSSIKGK